METSTADDYHARIQRVLRHLAAHLSAPAGAGEGAQADDALSLHRLADVASFSPFHFHRMFRAMVGETVGDLVRRLRLERAAHQMRSGGASVTDAAFAAGYESPEAFARAFKRACGLSPSDYRRAWPAPPLTRVQPRVHLDIGRDAIELEPITGGSTMDVRVEELPARRAVTLRLVGPYNEAGPLFERLFAWAGAAGLAPHRLRPFTLSYDDPDAVSADHLRSDICLELPLDREVSSDLLPEGAEFRDLPAARYAVHRVVGTYDGIHRAYQRLFRHWLPTSGEEVADLPCMELYLNDCRQVPEAALETDVCVPLKG